MGKGRSRWGKGEKGLVDELCTWLSRMCDDWIIRSPIERVVP